MNTQTHTTQQQHIKLDAGIAPLVARVGFVPHFRLYVILQELNRVDGNRQRVTVERLYAALGALGVEYQPQRYNQLITAGRGIFWNVGQGRRLYLVSWVNVWKGLLGRLEELGAPAAELGTYHPARLPVYVDVAGGLQAFTARLYAAWVGSRRAGMVTASRDAQGRIWGTSGRTIYTYARVGGVTVTPGYVQYAGPVEDAPHRGKDIRGDVREYRAGDDVRYSWQAPNTYGYINHEHNARGQQHKLRRATRRDKKQDAEIRAASKMFFDAGGDAVKALKQAQRHAKKHGPKWHLIHLGDFVRNGRGTRYYEAMNPHSTQLMTNAGESAPGRSWIMRTLRIFQHRTGLPGRAATPALALRGAGPAAAVVGPRGAVTGSPPDVLSAAAAAYVEALRRHALGALDALLSAAAEKRIAMDAERHRREVAAADDASTLLGLWHGHRAALNGLGA